LKLKSSIIIVIKPVMLSDASQERLFHCPRAYKVSVWKGMVLYLTVYVCMLNQVRPRKETVEGVRDKSTKSSYRGKASLVSRVQKFHSNEISHPYGVVALGGNYYLMAGASQEVKGTVTV
jgi:hypothetical protein